ncbi:MAG: peptidoglycan recognition family protein, partial [Planctomycetota bacterium]|nr:peptidoglycan recognition family protein [Planctomycetota bacterium]
WKGVGYHFVIGNGKGTRDGVVEPTFRWRQQMHGAHAGSADHNEHGIGICLIGNFENNQPTNAQREALIQLVQSLARDHKIEVDGVIGHGQIKNTKCPGRFFPVDEVLQGVREVATIHNRHHGIHAVSTRTLTAWPETVEFVAR